MPVSRRKQPLPVHEVAVGRARRRRAPVAWACPGRTPARRAASDGEERRGASEELVGIGTGVRNTRATPEVAGEPQQLGLAADRRAEAEQGNAGPGQRDPGSPHRRRTGRSASVARAPPDHAGRPPVSPPSGVRGVASRSGRSRRSPGPPQPRASRRSAARHAASQRSSSRAIARGVAARLRLEQPLDLGALGAVGRQPARDERAHDEERDDGRAERERGVRVTRRSLVAVAAELEEALDRRLLVLEALGHPAGVLGGDARGSPRGTPRGRRPAGTRARRPAGRSAMPIGGRPSASVRAPHTGATTTRRSGATSATGMSRWAGSSTRRSIERSTATGLSATSSSGSRHTASTVSAAWIASRSARACAA